MECTGMLKDVSLDFKSEKYIVSFVINEPVTQEMLEPLQDSKLSINVKKYRKHRSLDANRLLWACLGEIASTLRTDKWEVYLLMLKRYGKFTYICVKPNMVDAMKAQWRESEVIGEVDINGQKAVQLLCYFGSSTYNTQEFSVLLDGVVSEMVELGLQPPMSQDMKRALDQWEKIHEKAV